MSQSYNYSITTDFHSSTKVDTEALSAQIQDLINSGTINKILDSVVYDDGVDVDTVTVTFREALPTEEKAALDDVLGLHDGESLPSTITKVSIANALDAKGRLQIVQENRLGQDLTLATHNFCDATTWFSNSIRVNDEVLVTSDNYTYTSENINWINIVSGNVMDEDQYSSRIEHGYLVNVKSDGYDVAINDVYGSSGDCVIDYSDGTITFDDDQSGKEITVSYSYATNSEWVLQPNPGSDLQLEQAEAQFSDDLIMNDTLEFSIWAYNPYDLPNKVKVACTNYKRIDNFIDEALGSYPMIPPIGGESRGTVKATYGFPFMYNNVKILKSSQGIELRIKLVNDIEYSGERATATFYCSIVEE